MRYTIDVTQEHIDKGQRRICTKCPIALALQEQLLKAMVGIAHYSYKDNLYRFPISVQMWIIAFDRSEPVFPFTFEVKIP